MPRYPISTDPKSGATTDARPRAEPHAATVVQRRAQPHPATVAQRPIAPHRATVAQRRAAPAFAFAGGAVAQPSRDYLDDSHISSVAVPSMDGYEAHCQQRVTHFFQVVLKAVVLYRRHAGAAAPLPHLFTDHAAAQEGNGFRLGMVSAIKGQFKYDAAHLMNTTLIAAPFTALGMAPDDDNLVGLYRSSAATTTQFQTSNVSSDKIIDQAQTDAKNAMRLALNGGAALDEAFVIAQVQALLLGLQGSLGARLADFGLPTPGDQIKIESYGRAFAAVNWMLGNLEWVCREVWSEVTAFAGSL